MTAYLGIDVSKDKLDIALIRDNQTPLVATFDNTRKGFHSLKNFLNKRKITTLHACLEATGHYSDDIALFLHEQGFMVSVVNPARIKSYADSRLRHQKTDTSDAMLIADFCRTQQPDVWTPPASEIIELQALARHLDNLKTMRQQEINRRKAGIPSSTVLQTLDDHILFLTKQIDDLENQIRDHINRHPQLKHQHDLLKTIPGIGDLTAYKLLAEIRDIHAFQDASQLVAFAGLHPTQRISGTSVKTKPRLSKRGSTHLRVALFFPAMVAKKHNPILAQFARRLAEAGKCKKAVIGAVMRKLLHLVYGILKSGRPFDPHYLDNLAIPS